MNNNLLKNGRCMMRGTPWTILCGWLILPLLTSCATGPVYHRPEVKPPKAYKSAVASETPSGTLDRDWWRLFNDPELEALVKETLDANLDLKAAAARVTQSRAAASSVKSAFFPVVTMAPSATRSFTGGETAGESLSTKLARVSSTINQVSSAVRQINGTTGTGTTGTGTSGSASTVGLQSSGGYTSSRYQVPFDLSYEIDLWGRVRHSYESAQAQVQASEYDVETIRQTLLADLARNYFNLRSLDAQYEILARNLNLFQEQVDLTQNQVKAGLINETNLLQAKVQLESTRTQATDTQRQRADLEHAIAYLLGRAPADFSLPPRALAGQPPVIPAGLPADLLRQRPDVAEAEQNLIAACADIGVAQANFYPTVRLTGSAGFQSTDLKNLLDWSNRTASFGPNISLPIFKGGQLKANLRKAKARYEELDANYRQKVLSAFVDVEDALNDLNLRAVSAQSQAEAVASAREYLRLTQIQYKTGVTDYLHVVNAEQTLLNNELSEAQILNQRMVSTVLLVKAIGGGWAPNP